MTAPAGAVADPFRWLEDDTTPATTRWLRERAVEARAYLDSLHHRPTLIRWASTLFDLDQAQSPSPRPTGDYYLRTRPGDFHPSLWLRTADGDRPIIAPKDFGPPEHTYLTAWSASPDGQWLAYQLCHRGDEVGDVQTVRVGDMSPGPSIANIRRPALAWQTDTGGRPRVLFAADRRVSLDGRQPPAPYWRPPESPAFVAPSVSPDGRSLVVSVRYGADSRNELWTAELALDGVGRLTLLRPRGSGPAAVRFGPDGSLYLMDLDSTPKGQIVRRRPGTTGWEVVVPPHERAVIRAFAVSARSVAVVRSLRGRYEILRASTAAPIRAQVVVSDRPGSVDAITADPDGDRVWYEYQSPAEPPAVYLLGADGDDAIWHAAALPEKLPPLRTARETYRSLDGTEVDVTVYCRADRTRARAATLLTAYGGFGRSAVATFRTDAAVWIAVGGVYAVAHVRGGSERGARWHDAGRGHNKPRAIDDVIAAAEHLIRQGWSDPRRIALTGGSNGGMVLAAAAVRQPELFAACALSAPVTDLVRFPQLGDGGAWLAEYGDPARPDDLAVLLSYSPYHNVPANRRLPAFLLLAGNNDRRVPAAHARKFYAAVRASAPSTPVLLREDEGVGHGTRSRPARIATMVDRLAFLAHHAGLDLSKLPAAGVPQ